MKIFYIHKGSIRSKGPITQQDIKNVIRIICKRKRSA